jgi:hypothetical protein
MFGETVDLGAEKSKPTRTDRYLLAGVKPPRETPPEVQQLEG